MASSVQLHEYDRSVAGGASFSKNARVSYKHYMLVAMLTIGILTC